MDEMECFQSPKTQKDCKFILEKIVENPIEIVPETDRVKSFYNNDDENGKAKTERKILTDMEPEPE